MHGIGAEARAQLRKLGWPPQGNGRERQDRRGDAELLAGLYQSHKSDYGVLAACIEGRVIFQTFSTHDYRQDQTVPLWQNMITYTLSNHFKYMDQQPK